MNTKERGDQAERRALEFFVQRGWKALAQQYRCRQGEIDLIMQDADTLVFIEVRQRSRTSFGGAAESITATKIRRLWLAAQHYCQSIRWDGPCRFDVLTIDADDQLHWLPDAFEAWA